jgi:hypothetical protein
VGFDGVVVVGGWVPGWARIGAVHSCAPFLWAGPRGVGRTAEAFSLTPLYYHIHITDATL